jgi:hypothetical protein
MIKLNKGRGRPRKKVTMKQRHIRLPEGGITAALTASWAQAAQTLATWEQLEEVVGPAFRFQHDMFTVPNEEFELRVMLIRVRKQKKGK